MGDTQRMPRPFGPGCRECNINLAKRADEDPLNGSVFPKVVSNPPDPEKPCRRRVGGRIQSCKMGKCGRVFGSGRHLTMRIMNMIAYLVIPFYRDIST